VNRSTAFEVKGWCPGALRPMQSGDGLVVRIRPRSGTFSPHELRVLADAAQCFGNGHIDLTRRANLQLRGVSEGSLPPLHDAIAKLGLLDDSPDGEAVRNVMINPLAGIDPVEVLDARSVGRELERRLASEELLWALPSKFGFIVDGGGVLSLAEQRADIRLVAIARGQEVAFAVGLETRLGMEWLGSISPDTAATIAIEIGLAFIDIASRESRRRMRDLSDEGLASIGLVMKSRLDGLRESPRQADLPLNRRVGLIELGANWLAVGIAAPFGRIEAEQLRKLVDAIVIHGGEEIRVSPWRTLYTGLPNRPSAQSILDAAARDGFIIDPRDPLLQVEACPGAPACPSTALDTRGDGRRIAGWLPRFRFTGTVHVSGCAKGCAKSGPADLVLVGSEDRYGIARNATARDHATHPLSFAELAADPGSIFGIDQGHGHD
jgi:precorrin-3B synthase